MSDGSGGPRVNPDSHICDYYVPRKKRFCRTTKKPGSRFCHTHDDVPHTPDPNTWIANTPQTGAHTLNESAPLRVPCPINPNHTVYASRLPQHVRVCPDLRFIPFRLPYYAEDCHAFRGRRFCHPDAAQTARRTHHHLDKDALQHLVARVRDCYFGFIRPQIVLLAEETQTAHAADANGSHLCKQTSLKHAPQHRGLLHAVAKAMLSAIGPNSTHPTSRIDGFLELGAGKGGLSVALQEVLTSRDAAAPPLPLCAGLLRRSVSPLATMVVVDVDTFRRKGDATVARSDMPLTRLRVNIKDLDLHKALRDPVVRKRPREAEREEVLSTREHWVALGKHLCGACTDFALSCITAPGFGEREHTSFSAVVLATCCHHRCELQHVNPPLETNGANTSSLYLPGTQGTLSEAEFAAIASMSSWAVSGDFVDEERRVTGVCCKRVIDAIRLEYLLRHGYRSGYLCQYVERSITEENVCIVAFQ